MPTATRTVVVTAITGIIILALGIRTGVAAIAPLTPRPTPTSRSWATGICDRLGAECHYNAWSGFGMVANCCGGSTLASDVHWG